MQLFKRLIKTNKNKALEKYDKTTKSCRRDLLCRNSAEWPYEKRGRVT